MKTYNFLSDPSHGWLKVPFDDFLAVGLDLKKISMFSYYDRNQTHVYLEEDQDLRIFQSAYKKAFGVEPKIREMKQANKSSKVRSLIWNRFGESSLDLLREIERNFVQG